MNTERAAQSLLILLTLLSAPIPARAAEPAGWQARALEEIGAREYELGRQSDSWQAPNRAQDLRTFFSERETRVVPRREENPSWEWGLKLVGYGRPGDPNRVISEAPILATRGPRLERRWSS